MTLLYLVAAWVAGIFLAPAESPVGRWLALAALSLSLATLARRNRPWRLALLCGALFLLGASRYAWATRPLPANHIQRFVDSGYVTLTGLIDSDPDVRDYYVNLRIEVESITHQEDTTPTEGRVLAQAPRYGQYTYGDRVQVSGQLLTPPEYDDFSYRDYLARRGIHALMPNAEIDILEHDQGAPWYALMYDAKGQAQQTIDRLLPSPQAPLLSGILLGVETDISDDVREAFNRTGTTHVIAISGANIIVVIRVLMGLLSPGLGKKRAGWITMGGIGVYVLFVGGDPAVVRAAIMGGMAVLASQIGHRTYGLTTLAFAVWIMTLWSPLVLWDIGFQLSVAATGGLVLFGDIFTGGLEWLLKRGFAQETARQVTRRLSEPIAISLAAQVTTTPLILFYFGRLSVISLVANVLIVPAQSYIMTVGWLAVLLGMIWTGLGQPLAWVVWIPLTYTINIVRALGKIEWASVDFELSSTYAWAVYGLLLLAGMLIIKHPEDRAALVRLLRQRITAISVVVAGAILAILVWVSAWTQPDDKLHLWFLDVGHGHAVLVQTPDGTQMLIDGGPNPTRLRRALGDKLPFRDRDLDLLIITQPHGAAIDAIPELLEHYKVGLVLTNGQAMPAPLLNAMEAHTIDRLAMTSGYRVETGDGVQLEVIFPTAPPAEQADAEDAGLVLQLRYGDATFLITPDLSRAAIDSLLASGAYLGSTVLELPAHGHATINTTAFLDAARPQAAVVMAGAGNRAGLPDPATLERLQRLGNPPLFRTDHDGTIEIVTDGQTLDIFTER